MTSSKVRCWDKAHNFLALVCQSRANYLFNSCPSCLGYMWDTCMEQLDRSEISAIFFFQFFTLRFIDQHTRNMKHTKQEFTLMVSHGLQNLLEDTEAVLKISLPWQKSVHFCKMTEDIWNFVQHLFSFPCSEMTSLNSLHLTDRAWDLKDQWKNILLPRMAKPKSKLHCTQEVVRSIGVWPLELSFEKAYCVHWVFSDSVQGLFKWNKIQQ